MRFEVLERTTYEPLGVELWRVLDRRFAQVEWVLFTGARPGDRYARGWVIEEAEARWMDAARPKMLTRLARACGVDLSPPPPPEPKRMTPPEPVLEPDAGALWRLFIYGTAN